ncbi:heat-shock protein Hsp15 [Bacteroidia bacterium]|nr:heat-shock protein Hsp15 [Bacteroidia bacterium]GHT80247.1 heat-shock protein Hsp15 [Bacteroidia bacterium]
MLRIDKFLWAVRVYKTRTEAADACKHGRIMVRNQAVKPSYEVKLEDVIVVRKNPVHYHYQVVSMPASRVGAKLVADFVKDITPQEELNRLNDNKLLVFAERDRGSARPTKRDRRKLKEALFNE